MDSGGGGFTPDVSIEVPLFQVKALMHDDTSELIIHGVGGPVGHVGRKIQGHVEVHLHTVSLIPCYFLCANAILTCLNNLKDEGEPSLLQYEDTCRTISVSTCN